MINVSKIEVLKSVEIYIYVNENYPCLDPGIFTRVGLGLVRDVMFASFNISFYLTLNSLTNNNITQLQVCLPFI